MARTKRPPPSDPPPRLNGDGSCRAGCTCLLCQCSMPSEAGASSSYRRTPAFDGNAQSSSHSNRDDRIKGGVRG